MLKESSLSQLRAKKNLLAFSAGVDSTALFFLLQDKKIDFDIAIVNYNTRKQSINEVQYAQELAQKYHLSCHLFSSEIISKNFEAKARTIRYDFFHSLINSHGYENLLTAHHLGDRFEWMLMQFCKGAGCVELSGMKELEERKDYTLVRPLLNSDKSELLLYLKKEKIKYFEDISNQDEKISRNSFRINHTKPLLEKYLQGIKKSFDYLDEDREILQKDIKIHTLESLTYFESSFDKRADIIAIDKALKQRKHLITATERKLLKETISLEIGRKFIVNQTGKFVFITPSLQKKENIPKEFKEHCRILKIDSKIRSYLYANQEIFKKVESLLS